MSDLISRQAAIDALHMLLMYRMGTDSNKKRLDEWINNLPSAQPERKPGEWILSDAQNPEDVRNGNYTYTCSNCLYSDIHAKTAVVPFCWHCGADMRGEQNEKR